MFQNKVLMYLVRFSIIRSLYYSLRFKGMIIIGRKSRIITQKGSRIEFTGKGRLIIGIEYYSPIEATIIKLGENSSLQINGRVSIKKGCLVSLHKNSLLSINDSTFINEGSKLLIYNRCTIGSGCAISFDVVITDSDIHQLGEVEPTQTVIIGNDVWIGFRCSIIKGAHLSGGCVVGCNSLVNKFFPERSLIAGSPGKVIRANVSWAL
jgi:acetyltransferase-like isoleucine patch superfamily enzyme